MVQQLCNDGRADTPQGDQPVEVLDLHILLVVAQRLLHPAVVKVRIETHARNAAAADALPLAAQQLCVTLPLLGLAFAPLQTPLATCRPGNSYNQWRLDVDLG